MSEILWKPSADRTAHANLTKFMADAAADWNLPLGDYETLRRWSVEAPDQFWASLWKFLGIISSVPFRSVFAPADHIKDFEWFPGVRLNHAENLLRRRDDTPALVHWREGGRRESVTFKELYGRVSRLVQALRDSGVSEGDRVIGILPNCPDAVVAMLAANSLGAIWSLCSPDFGAPGVLERFRQIAPSVLFAASGYSYKGERHDTTDRLNEIIRGLPSLRRVILVGSKPRTAVPNAVTLDEFVAPFGARDIAFAQLPFDQPAFILFTSGTTGAPKCIVHGQGGLLLQLLKEHRLHYDVNPGDRFFYFTTTGWNMWYWLTTALAAEAAVVLYDGSPFHPHDAALFDIVDRERLTVFGTSPKYLLTLCQRGVFPRDTHDLGSLRTVLSTGSPLSGDGFDFVYEHIKEDVCLSSISGGTEIMANFATGNPAGPVRRGELQVRALGMKAEVYDDGGRPLVGKKGELVCTAAFPSMPVRFWNDPGNARYRATYFERFPGVWHHGDFAELTESSGMIIHGRSDATLMPGGVRIGTAEIYNPVNKIEEVVDCLVIGQSWQNDVRVVLFVQLADGLRLDQTLIDKIKAQIIRDTTPRHIPAKIVQVGHIPRTKTGKIAELAVQRVVNGEPVTNRNALADPAALNEFANLAELAD